MSAIALVRTATFDQQHGDTARAFAQLLDPHQLVGQSALTAGRQFGLGRHHTGVEFGQLLAQFTLAPRGFGAVTGQRLESATESGDLATGQEDLQRAQFGDEITVTARGLRLPLERTQLPADFAQEVLHTQEARFGCLEATLGLLLAFAELENTGRLFDDRAAIFRTRVEDGIDLTLAHDHVLLTTHAGVGKQFLHVEQTALHAVDRVLALAGSEQRAADAHFAELDGQEAGRVVESQSHLGAPEGRPLGGTGEDDVVHLLATHRTGGLRAENPGDGVHHVRLARTVGSDHHRDPWFEVHDGGVGEGLEALEGQRLQEHGTSDPSGRTRRWAGSAKGLNAGRPGTTTWSVRPPRRWSPLPGHT